MRVTLDDKNWAEITDPSELRSGDRRAVNRAVRLELDGAGQPIFTGAMTEDMRDALLCRVISNWSLDFPVPAKDAKSLEKLTLDQEDALKEAVQPHLDLINGRVNPEERGSDPTAGSKS